MGSFRWSSLLLGVWLLPHLLAQEGFWYPAHDGVKRVINLSAENFNSTLQNNPVVVVLFTLPKTDDPASQKMWGINERMLELTAQLLEKKGVKVGTVNMAANMDLVQKEGAEKAGAVYIYNEGSKVVYSGYRSAETLVAFVNKLSRSGVTVLAAKPDKKAFTAVESTKVIGYFLQGSPEFQAFETAAQKYIPHLPFFVVYDAMMAREMKIDTLGTIHVEKPFEKIRKVVPQNPATEADIHAFLAANAKPLLRRLNLEDVHAAWEEGEAKIVAFVRPKSPEGAPVYKVLKNLVKFSAGVGDLSILMIDPDLFPALTSYWQTVFNLDLNQPAIGLINVTDNNNTWFDVNQLRVLVTEVDQIAALQLWLEDIVAGRIRVDGLEPEQSSGQAGQTGTGGQQQQQQQQQQEPSGGSPQQATEAETKQEL